MNRQQLVDAVGERLGDRKTAAVAVEAVLDTVTGALAQGERVSLFGFGVFEKVDRAARTARNPATGGTVEVPATAVPRFRPGQVLKDAVSGRASRASTSAPAPTGPRRRAGAAKGADAPPELSPTDDPKAAGKKAKGGGKAKDAKDAKGAKGKADGKKGKGKSK
jgi:DNA-binding protein HU-beta